MPRKERSEEETTTWSTISKRVPDECPTCGGDPWLTQRNAYANYESNDNNWLTRGENSYQFQPLKYILEGACKVADIETATRKMSWNSIHHSVTTYTIRGENLAAAQAQLRHKSSEPIMRYDQAPVKDRKNALDTMGGGS
jgi:hypothetical protein